MVTLEFGISKIRINTELKLKNSAKNSLWQIFLKIGVLRNFALFIGKHLCWSLRFNKAAGLKVCKKDALKNFAKFTGKHMCWSLFLNKVAGLKAYNFIEKRLQHRCFPDNIAKFLRTPFFKEHPWWLLLSVQKTHTRNF